MQSLSLGTRRLVAGLAILGVLVLWIAPNADAWFRFVLALMGAVQ